MSFSNPVPVAVINKPLRVTDLAWEFLRPVLKPGDTVVDATAGTGQDTLFLRQCVGESGRVFAFDIQAVALQQTKCLLDNSKSADNVTLICDSHEFIRIRLADAGVGEQAVKAVMFNLGYFPGGDPAIITEGETTIKALNSALRLLSTGGMMTICLYPGHPGGSEEAQAVIGWCEMLETPFVAHHFQTLNRKSPPTLVIIQRTR
ncbi:class I SAM-dependent methyltransferase [Acetobacterium sp. MES1]|uniref:tRNA (mnm(5)s(2)U34)-methyltransferase n=1 Tax=Acetobacterium sp. MES1 TaxID=1899015 RepID=UPI00257F35DD|nr:class I SAM-dependent methyltransferase [Acetobacterium sp. MES1]